jgi:hypothetical protein
MCAYLTSLDFMDFIAIQLQSLFLVYYIAYVKLMSLGQLVNQSSNRASKPVSSVPKVSPYYPDAHDCYRKRDFNSEIHLPVPPNHR